MTTYFVDRNGTGEYPFNTLVKAAQNFSELLCVPDSFKAGVWRDVAISSTGQYIALLNYPNEVHISNDYGLSWAVNTIATLNTCDHVSISASGQHIAVTTSFDYLFISNDYGVTWNPRGVQSFWQGVTVSATGQYMIALGYVWDQNVYISSDYGLTFTPILLGLSGVSCAISSTGQYQMVGIYDPGNCRAYISSDYGATWPLTVSTGSDIPRVAVNGSGEKMIINSSGTGTIVSPDYGGSWNTYYNYKIWGSTTFAGSNFYAINGDGSSLDRIFYSSDGIQWFSKTRSNYWSKQAIIADETVYALTLDGPLYRFETLPALSDGDVVEVSESGGSIEVLDSFPINKSITVRSWSGNTNNPVIDMYSDCFHVTNAGSPVIQNLGFSKFESFNFNAISFLSGIEDSPVITGCSFYDNNTADDNGIYINGSSFNSLLIQNNIFSSFTQGIKSLTDLANITITNNKFDYGPNGIVFQKVSNAVIEKNVFNYGNFGVIVNDDSQDVTIKKNYFNGLNNICVYFNASIFYRLAVNNNQFYNDIECMNFFGNVYDSNIINNTLYTVVNGIVALYLTNTNIVNNILFGEFSGSVGIQVSNFISGLLDYNDVYSFLTLYNVSGAVSVGPHSISLDPVFNLRSGSGYPVDMFLLKTSPCLDAGIGHSILSAVPEDDFRSGVRPISLPGYPHVTDGTDIGAFEDTEREAGLQPQAFFISATGSDTAPYNTPAKASTTLFNISFFYKDQIWPGDSFEVVDDGMIIDNGFGPYNVPRGIILRSWSGNHNKPTIKLSKSITVFFSGITRNIKFLKDGDILTPGPTVGNFLTSIYADPDQETSGCEFRFINAPTEVMYVIGVPALSTKGANNRIVNNVFRDGYPAIAIENAPNSVIANNTIFNGNKFSNPSTIQIQVNNTADACNGSVILNNIIHSGSGIGIAISITDINLTQDYNCIHGVGTEYDGAAISGPNNIDSINTPGATYPGFMAYDFLKLYPNSSCAVSGAKRTDYPVLPETDYDGNSRPATTELSRGAYELIDLEYFYKDPSTTALTGDTDDGRINTDICAVVTPNDRKIVFYSKTFDSGRLSDSRVTYTLPFTINVEAGNGQINSIPVVWGAAVLTVDPNTFTLIYVSNTGVVGKTTDFPISFVKDVIVLAYVSSGGSEIVYVEEVEKVSKFIYAKRQAASTGRWVWDDYEFVLNTGEQPRAFYDPVTDRVYMSYKKDGIALCRLFDLSTETTWAYVANKYLVSEQMYLSHDPESSLYFGPSTGFKSEGSVTSVDLFPLANTPSLCFIYITGSFKPFIFLPFVTGSFLSYIKYPYYIDIYTFDGFTYSLENTVEFYDNSLYLLDVRLYQCPTDNQDRYLGVRVNHDLIGGQYETLPENRIHVNVFPAFIETEVLTNITSEAIDGRTDFKASTGSVSELVKVLEYEETRDFEIDNSEFKASTGSVSEMAKTFEYEETRDFETDNSEFKASVGSHCEVIIS